MTRKEQAFRPGATALEPRTLLSGAAAEVQALATPITVAGTIRGNYRAGIDGRAADAPLVVRLTGSGKVQGPVRLNGSLTLGGFLPVGVPDATGTIRLTNNRGTLVLALSGSGGQLTVPRNRLTLNATVVSGTGIYSTLEGSGTATAVFGRNTLRARSLTAPIAGTATFSVRLDGAIGGTQPS